jgi:hypothetical protein
VGNTGTSQLLRAEEMTDEEIAAYTAGFEYNEQFGDKKNWG